MLKLNWDNSEEVVMLLHIMDNNMLDTKLLDDYDLEHFSSALAGLIKYDGYYGKFFIEDKDFSSSFLEDTLKLVGYSDKDIEAFKTDEELYNEEYPDYDEDDEFEIYVGEIDFSNTEEVLNFLKSIAVSPDDVDYSDDLLKSSLREFILDNIECEYDSENEPCLYLSPDPDILTHDEILDLFEELDFCSYDIYGFTNYGCTLRQALDRMLISQEEYNEIMYPSMQSTIGTIEGFKTYLVNHVPDYEDLASMGACAEVIIFRALLDGNLSFDEVDGYGEYFSSLIDTLPIDNNDWGYIVSSYDEIFKYFEYEEILELVTILDMDYRQHYAALNGFACDIYMDVLDELTYYEYLGILDKIYLEDILESNFDTDSVDLSSSAVEMILNKVFNNIEYCLEYYFDELISLFKYLIGFDLDSFKSFRDFLSQDLVQTLLTSGVPMDIVKYFL